MARRSQQAPVDIGKAFQMVRAIGGLSLAVTGAVLLHWQVAGASHMIVPSLVITGHALSQLRRPFPGPFGSLLLDASLAGVSILLVGRPDAIFLAALTYFVIASLALLPRRQATVMLAYVSIWAAPILLVAPVAGIDAEGVGDPIPLGPVGASVLLLVIVALLGVITRSILQSKGRQAAALETERDAVKLKNQFVSMVSHELRTPLTSIAGFVETLGERWRDLSEEEIDEFLRIVHGETLHLSHLVEDVLVIPRLEAGKLTLHPEPFELRPVVHHLSTVLATDNHQIAIEIPSGVMVNVDPLRFQQVIRNLLSNAIKHGGDEILVEGRDDGLLYRITVSDNGAGVPEAHRDRIFEHFEQVAESDHPISAGIGLGLPIARRLARAMGGDIWYEERFPRGARFCFLVQRATAAASEVAQARHHAPSRSIPGTAGASG